LLSPEFTQEIYATAVRELYRVWYQESESSTEEQKLEIHRLALLGDEKEIASKIAYTLARNWRKVSRFRETVQICKSTIEVSLDYRVLKEFGFAEQNFGNVQQALDYYQQAINLCPEEDLNEKASLRNFLGTLKMNIGDGDDAITLFQQAKEIYEKTEGNEKNIAASLHQMAIIYAKQGQVDQAIALYQQSLEITDRIGYVQGKVATLGAMADIYGSQGLIKKAFEQYQQVLEIARQIGTVEYEATALHQIAGIYAQQGQVDQAITLYQQSLEIKERIGNVQGKAATLHQMAGIYAQQGQVDQAIALYQQSLEIERKIGNVHGLAPTLEQIAILLITKKGDFQAAISCLEESFEIRKMIKSPDAEAIGQLLEQVRAMAG
jgi:tetratricopeptide (TPR) repeat protein